MRGTILGYDATSHTGAISGHDGNRYDFALSEWKSPGLPAKGTLVDFVPVDGEATKIYAVETPAVSSESWLNFLFSSSGRIPRKRYWLSYVLPVVGIYIVAIIFDVMVSASAKQEISPFRGLASLFFLWPSFAVIAKRLHDRRMSGWWAAFANGVVPVVILAIAAYWYYTKMNADRAPPDPTTGLVIGLVCLALGLGWLYLVIQIGFVRGQVGQNKYGDDPLPTPADVRSDYTVTTVFGILTALFLFVLPVSAYWYYTKMNNSLEDTPRTSTEGIDPNALMPSEESSSSPEPSGTQMPTEDATPPAEDATPPAEDATPPAEEVPPPAGGTTPPAR